MALTPEGGPAFESGSAHPSAGSMAAFLDRRLTGNERETLVDHLSECAPCRAEFRAAREIERRQSHRRSRRTIAAGAALAASLVIAAIPLLRRQENPAIAERGITPRTLPSSIPAIDAVSPRDEGALSAKDLHFVWRSDSPDAEFRIALQDSSGHVLWSTTTADTAVALPSEIHIGRGDYFWTVDALRADGRTATTGVQRLTIK